MTLGPSSDGSFKRTPHLCCIIVALAIKVAFSNQGLRCVDAVTFDLNNHQTRLGARASPPWGLAIKPTLALFGCFAWRFSRHHGYLTVDVPLRAYRAISASAARRSRCVA